VKGFLNSDFAVEQHYLKSVQFVGERLRYVAGHTSAVWISLRGAKRFYMHWIDAQ
jgi:hypothetical protein